MNASNNFLSARRGLVVAMLGASAFLVAACATQGEPPVAGLAVARTSVTQADAAGAAKFAPVEYLSARDKLTRAEAAMKGGQYNNARTLSDEAAVDADLAERKARAAKAANAAIELQRSNAVLGTELDRAATPR